VPAQYKAVVEAIATSGEVDAVIVIFIPPLAIARREVAAAIRAARVPRDVTLLNVFMTSKRVREVGRVPTYAFPEEAARALSHAVRYATWRALPDGRVPVLAGIRPDEAKVVLATSLATGNDWMDQAAVARLLDCYGLSPVASELVKSPADAATAAHRIGGPVALKAMAPGLLHKTEAGGVRLGLTGRRAVLEAARAMAGELAASGHAKTGFVVQPMVPGGVEMLVGVVNDPSFGPVLACGAGGTTTELLRDVAVRITPLTVEDAHAMPRALATFPLLDGYRGAPKLNVAALEQLLLRVSQLVETNPEIAELDLNPVIVHTEGVTVVDARVRLREALPAALPGTR